MWPNVTVDTITSVGVAFLLTFVLFAFERRFTRNVAAQVRDTTEAAVAVRTKALGARLDELEARLSARRAETEATQNRVVDAIAEEVSFSTLAAALSEAERVGAIEDGSLTVPASTQPPWLAAQFRFGTSHVVRGDGLIINDGTVPSLTVKVEVEKLVGEFGRPIFEVEWDPATESDEVGDDLTTQLRHRGRLGEAKVFDFSLAVRELQRGLRLALSDQRSPAGSEALHGHLLELVGEDWAITRAGVENLRTGLLLTLEEIGLSSRGRLSEISKVPIMPPSEASPEQWNYLRSRAGLQPVRHPFL